MKYYVTEIDGFNDEVKVFPTLTSASKYAEEETPYGETVLGIWEGTGPDVEGMPEAIVYYGRVYT